LSRNQTPTFAEVQKTQIKFLSSNTNMVEAHCWSYARNLWSPLN